MSNIFAKAENKLKHCRCRRTKSFLTKLISTVVIGSIAIPAFSQNAADQLSINFEKPGIIVSPTLYGIFFEEIGRAGEGGIYAEMLQNRSFESPNSAEGWRAVDSNISLDKSLPMSQTNLTSLRVEVSSKDGGGVSNGGYVHDWGTRGDLGSLSVEKGKKYNLTIYVRSQDKLSLTVSLQGSSKNTLDSQKITGIGSSWKKFTVTLTPSASDANSQFVIKSDQPGTYWLDMVSLFPRDTWKGRKNGLRPDLMEKLVAMKPAFVRFPGGCFVEGFEPENRVQWKKTIGDIADRPGHMNRNWGYWTTDGLGAFEFFQMCEDLGAEPLFVINCGIGHKEHGMYAFPMSEMQPFVQDALDIIEYANGSVTSKWGSLRAKAGHPKPFNLKMMEIGNENGGPDYQERFDLIYDAIKAKYPNMQLIANEPIKDRRPDIVDVHDYNTVESFLKNAKQFDTTDRNAPNLYVGEYAMTVNAGNGTLEAGLAEAAYMTGLERNSDVVKMASYAPLLCYPDWRWWNPNAILFNQNKNYGTPSYWVQCMFANNRAKQILPVDMNITLPAAPKIHGKIGVGSWNTQAEFKDIKVVKGDQTLFASDFSKGLDGWQTSGGQWGVVDGVLQQSGSGNGTQALIGDESWSDYTLTLKARKISGAEGFLITFGATKEDRPRWNIGGWGNTSCGLEATGLDVPHVNMKVETGRWYDIKVEVNGTQAKCYLDGELIHTANRMPLATFAAVAGMTDKAGETILKFVNASSEARSVKIDLDGAKSGQIAGVAEVLTSGNVRDENSFDTPNSIVPLTTDFSASVPDFSYTFPANSLTILRWK